MVTAITACAAATTVSWMVVAAVDVEVVLRTVRFAVHRKFAVVDNTETTHVGENEMNFFEKESDEDEQASGMWKWR